MFEQLSPSAWDRLMDRIARPWHVRLDLLDGAFEELTQVDRNATRLQFLDEQIRRVEEARDAARRDLVALDRRRDLAVERAVEQAGRKARWNRTRAMQDAREREQEFQDAAIDSTRRTIVSRMATADRELQSLHTDRAPIGLDPILHDDLLVDWLRTLRGVVDHTRQRDRAAHKELIGPWERRREVSLAIASRLEELCEQDFVGSRAFGEGAIHLVAGRRLAVVEVREGRGTVRAEDRDDTTMLYDLRPDGDAPLGLLDGTTRRLQEAAQRVAAATGAQPAMVVVVTGHGDEPTPTGRVVLCGPSTVGDALNGLPAARHSADERRAASARLDEMELPPITAPQPPSLSHLHAVEPGDVPSSLPMLLELVESARRSPSREAHSSESAAA